ncbi:MAG TPA: glycosyltransferase family 39 protein [Candidatus Goldiibacteriota bacterium]|nr:glycosyltransferase family 39 protein [Candidatus Goldiibacteriota bacterium]HPI02349.1 glycosyltransferase family 39 protein [Candidatus Goldiibacteriota bacterium]HPN63740.1 glycosyltransferase family 39 protein [Candidatus Goldiibacteriota bacterium]HRQ42998.1 glycosyltransferase family 39 protein [Candidatus Goldiibacteriota bacterium]
MSADEKSISLKTVIFFAVLVSVFALFRLFFIFNPLDSTEGELAYFGQNTGAETMYAGKSTALMPLGAYIYRTAFTFAGENAEAIRKLGVIYFLMAAALLFMAARTYFGTALSVFAVFMYGLFQNTYAGGGLNAYPSYFSQIFLLLAFLFIAELEEGFENADYALSGAFTAAAFLTAAQAVFFVLLPLFFILTRDKKTAGKKAVYFIAGFLIVFISCCVYMQKEGMLAGFFAALLPSFDLKVQGEVISIFTAYWAGFASAALCVAAALIKKIKPESAPVLAALLAAVICGAAGLITKEKGAFLCAAPFLALSVSMLFQSAGMDKDSAANKAVITAAAVVIIIAHFYISGMKGYLASGGLVHEKQYDSINAAEVIKNTGAKTLNTYCAGGCMEVYFLSGLKYSGNSDIICMDRSSPKDKISLNGYGIMAETKYYRIFGKGVKNEKNK